MVKIKYHSLTIDNKEKIKFNKFELKSDVDVRVMWSTFYRCATKDSIKVYVTLTRSTTHIIKKMKHLELSVTLFILCM